jgi:TPP-dependent pyruvate/acetoin dehydrogenase alpha subunit
MGTNRSAPAAAAEWGPAEIDMNLGLYRVMRRIRRFEETVQELFLRDEVYGTTHLCIGHEAVSAGVASVLTDEDRVAATYRGHGHALALGVPSDALLAEMLGRASGINGGRSGSMNVTSLEHRLIGSFGIVGGSIAAAIGAGLALKRSSGVAVAFFGDGATNQGYFFECLNFAAVFDLPVVFVCENNLYGEYTLTTEVSRGDIGSRGRSLGVVTEQVDGMDVSAIREAARGAVARARAGDGPSFIEAMTYRFVGHSRSDPAKYRPAGELDVWRARDPLKLSRDHLLAAGVDGASIDDVDMEVEAEIAAASALALSAPWPDPGEIPSEFAPAAL